MSKKKDKRIREEGKEGEYLITYTRHLEKRLRNLETEKQLPDAERLRLEQELHGSRNEVGKNRKEKAKESPIYGLMELVPANIRNVFGEILEKLMHIVLSTRNLGDQSLQDVSSKISNLLEEIKKIDKGLQKQSEMVLKWYELHSVSTEQPPVRNNREETQDYEEYDYTFKIIVLGKPEKTAFILKFVTGRFMKDIRNTLGADFYGKTITVDGKTVRLQIFDFATEERFRRILPQFIRETNGAIIMYDIIDAKTLEIILEVIELVKKNVGEIPIFLALAEFPSKEGQRTVLTEKYTLTEITSETGPNGEHAFELLTKKMID